MKTEIKYLYKGPWDETNTRECYHWLVLINDVEFRFRMGLAHVDKNGKPKQPTVEQVIYNILNDSDLSGGSFPDFCANLGYDEDSRKALDIYLKCQESGMKLRKALGREYDSVTSKIRELEL